MEMNRYVYYKGMRVFSGCPHDEEEISQSAANEILHGGGYLLRNLFDFDCSQPTSFWWVIKDGFGGMEELASKTRNMVRRALKTYDIQKINADEFRRIALPLYNAALESYRVKAAPVTAESIEKTASAPGQEFWAVYEKSGGRAVALARCKVCGDCCDYGTLKCLPEALHNATYPYYGLLYEMNRHYLQERGFRYVFDGTRSITGHSNIQPFLERTFRFRKAYCQLKIFYRPWMKVAVSVLYPFRKYLPLKVRSVLNLEAMRRGKM